MELKLLFKDIKQNFPVLLIVPYGIETLSDPVNTLVHHAFNRTLWN